MTNYFKEIDIIKAFAALSVIAIHASGPYTTGSNLAYLWNQSVRYAVPLFIILSGLLLQYSNLNKKSIPTMSFISRRFSKIGIPYVLWTLIYIVYSARHQFSKLWENIEDTLYQFGYSLLTGNGHLYFVVIIFQLYLLYPSLRKALYKQKNLTLITTFLLTLYFQTASFLNGYHINLLPGKIMGYAYILFPTWIFYFTLGMVIADSLEIWKNRILSVNKVFIVVLWLSSFIILYFESKITGSYTSSTKPTIMLYSITSLIFFYILAHTIQDRFLNTEKFLIWLGIQSFFVYLAHPLIMGLYRWSLNIFGFPGAIMGKSGMILYFLISTILSIFAAYIFSFIPITHWFGGVYLSKNNNSSKVVIPMNNTTLNQ